MYKYTEEELLEDLIEVTEEEFDGVAPSQSKAVEFLEASIATYNNRFGGWNNSLREANIKVENEVGIPDSKLIEEIKRVSEEHFGDECPSCLSMEKYSKYSNKTFQDRFGSWNNAVREAGLEVNQEPNYNEEDLIEELHIISERYCDGKTPNAEHVDEHGKWTTPVYYDAFESFNIALEKAGFSVNRRSPGQGTKISYGESYHGDLKERIYSRDGYVCAVCESENSYGYRPDIHHITPHYYWIVEEEHEKMNHPRNLIPLCRSCHRKLEGKFKGRNYEEFKQLAREFLDMDEEAIGLPSVSDNSVFDY